MLHGIRVWFNCFVTIHRPGQGKILFVCQWENVSEILELASNRCVNIIKKIFFYLIVRCSSTVFTKGNNYYDFLFAEDEETLPK